MKCNMRFFSTLVVGVIACGGLSETAVAVQTANFEDLSLGNESYWDGPDMTGAHEVVADPWVAGSTMDLYHGSFSSANAAFSNNYNATYPSWDGWAYSNRTDTASKGWTNQYTAVAGPAGGQGSSKNYGVAYMGYSASVPTISFAAPVQVQSGYFTNNTYAYYSMLEGNDYPAKKFGCTWNESTGSWDNTYAQDWFLLTITGKDGNGATTGTVGFYLADFRFANDVDDYIVQNWTPVSLSSLGTVRSLEFQLTSSDVGGWGMNTPAYFAMDNLQFSAVPEPSTLALLVVGGFVALAWRWRRKS